MQSLLISRKHKLPSTPIILLRSYQSKMGSVQDHPLLRHVGGRWPVDPVSDVFADVNAVSQRLPIVRCNLTSLPCEAEVGSRRNLEITSSNPNWCQKFALTLVPCGRGRKASKKKVIVRRILFLETKYYYSIYY